MTSSKIRLRDWTLADLESYRHWQKPGHQWQTLDGPYYQSKSDESERKSKNLRKYIESTPLPTPRMQMAIADINTDKLLGSVTSYWESIETQWLCIGITIYDPHYWGKGIGTEAMKLWVDYLFSHRPEIVRLDMRTWSGNQGLMNLARKLGFTQEACFRNARIVDGKYYDGLGYGILRSEWQVEPL